MTTETVSGTGERDLYEAKEDIRRVIEAWQDSGMLPTFTAGCADEIVRVLKARGVGFVASSRALPPPSSPEPQKGAGKE